MSCSRGDLAAIRRRPECGGDGIDEDLMAYLIEGALRRLTDLVRIGTDRSSAVQRGLVCIAREDVRVEMRDETAGDHVVEACGVECAPHRLAEQSHIRKEARAVGCGEAVKVFDVLGPEQHRVAAQELLVSEDGVPVRRLSDERRVRSGPDAGDPVTNEAAIHARKRYMDGQRHSQGRLGEN